MFFGFLVRRLGGQSPEARVESLGEFPVWWPNSSAGSNSPISIGAEGKGAAADWYEMANDPNCLTFHAETNGTGTFGPGYFSYDYDNTSDPNCTPNSDSNDIDFTYEDSYVTYAQASLLDVMYTFFRVPQWAVCYPYMNRDFYGGLPGSRAAVDCGPNNSNWTWGAPIDPKFCDNNGNQSGTAYCAGPEADPNFGNIRWFAQALVRHYFGYGMPLGTKNVAINKTLKGQVENTSGGSVISINDEPILLEK